MPERDRAGAALFLAVGIALGGWFVGRGFEHGRAADRFVTVKGVAERDVTADVALWRLRFVATGDDLGQARGDLRRSHDVTLAFLRDQGIDAAQVQVESQEVNDTRANPWRTPDPNQVRYIVSETVLVRSSEPDGIQRASQAVGDLIDQGVVLANDGPYAGGPTYLYTRLNDVKPEMIAEATAAARKAAEQFARDAASPLGSIRRANQGVFEILPRDRAPGVDQASQVHKTVRVVSTIDYFLED
ncbi:MAG: SIMPL domain-containing protein [Acidobacteriota bacterium]|jgi:hypothetical protein